METRAQVKDFLARHKNFSSEPISKELLPSTFRERISKAIKSDGSLQLLTHRDGTDAMFMAMLRRTA
jgi:16S rRNA C967 or C1407 C5-methylase (RsmB/RsmF family)